MCAVSFIGDSYKRFFEESPFRPWHGIISGVGGAAGPSKADFDALKAKVEEMLAMLKAARQFDIATGQKDCQMDEKIEMLRKVADVVGLDITNVVFRGGPDGTDTAQPGKDA